MLAVCLALLAHRPNKWTSFPSGADKKYGRPIEGQQEVAASKARTGLGLWVTAEGIFFPLRSA